MTFIRRFLSLPAILIIGDLFVLTLFVFIGQRDHDLIDASQPVLGLLKSTVVFAVPWLLTGWWLGGFRVEDASATRSFLARSLNVWLVAALLGLLLRAYGLGRAVIPTVFVTATLGFGGIFLLGWRLAFAILWKTGIRRHTTRTLS